MESATITAQAPSAPLQEYLLPISSPYDPTKNLSPVTVIARNFAFLDPEGDKVGSRDLANSIPISPSLRRVPWPSNLPGCRQNKHWRIAERMTRDLFEAIYKHVDQAQDASNKLPLQLYEVGKQKMHKEAELVGTAVKSTAYMFPDASPARAGMIAQSMLLIFLHDDKEYLAKSFKDVVEEFTQDAGSTITNSFMIAWKQAQSNIGESSQDYIHSLLAGFIDEDPILGKKLLEGAFLWVDHTKEYESVPTESLREYLDYRSKDIGTDLLLAQAAFAADISLSEAERGIFEKFIGLFADHISLTNDIYSFEKEWNEHVSKGAYLVNGVDVVRRLHNIPVSAAKQFICEEILKLEQLLALEIDHLKQDVGLNKAQERFGEALALCLAGHIFYSATNGRYGGADSAATVE
ncbi:uncharacterized protein N7503_007331 [Penicillium pulvis]|uniref:uncharacterized protein n=1 Tax=Penicillium pulvis TaxID=1562058 RepID=UPI0025488419|nr:uncharacterized protein N7503_007331 [Penicillium pulvis]KAJ5798035.1 hypothetical protein N7503_007331 [Penicillium pulvis]